MHIGFANLANILRYRLALLFILSVMFGLSLLTEINLRKDISGKNR